MARGEITYISIFNYKGRAMYASGICFYLINTSLNFRLLFKIFISNVLNFNLPLFILRNLFLDNFLLNCNMDIITSYKYSKVLNSTGASMNIETCFISI